MFNLHTASWQLFRGDRATPFNRSTTEESELNNLRASLDDVIEQLSDDPMFFITNEGPVTGGYDVVMGSKGLAVHGVDI